MNRNPKERVSGVEFVARRYFVSRLASPSMITNSETLTCRNLSEWKSWLADHHAESSGIWLVIAKKGSDLPLITISDALDGALCFGWIDSQRKGRDSETYLQRYSRRTARSPWSKLNRNRAEALIAAGRMQKAGEREVLSAKSDGRWAIAYAPQRTVELPRDFLAALKPNARAWAAFERLAKTARYAVILPILKATTGPVRSARIQKAVAELERSAVERVRVGARKKRP